MTTRQQGRQMQGEEAIIQGTFAPLARGYPGAFGLTDDAALVTPEPGTELVLTTDAVAEGVHFLPDDLPEDIAWKALAVNISDLAGKGARPIGYLMALSFPALPPADWLAAFARGLADAQASFGCHLIGGDTDRRPGPLTVTITAIGAVLQGRMVRRATARRGDTIFVSGTLGDAALGLDLRKGLQQAARLRLSSTEANHLLRRYARPEPRLGLAEALRAHASAAMDLSDGLAKDLARLCRASNCAGHVRFADIPVSPAAARALAVDPTGIAARIAASGDDYEILAAVPPAAAGEFVAAAVRAGIPVTAIGVLSSGHDVVIAGPDGRPMLLPSAGWDHF